MHASAGHTWIVVAHMVMGEGIGGKFPLYPLSHVRYHNPRIQWKFAVVPILTCQQLVMLSCYQYNVVVVLGNSEFCYLNLTSIHIMVVCSWKLIRTLRSQKIKNNNKDLIMADACSNVFSMLQMNVQYVLHECRLLNLCHMLYIKHTHYAQRIYIRLYNGSIETSIRKLSPP